MNIKPKGIIYGICYLENILKWLKSFDKTYEKLM